MKKLAIFAIVFMMMVTGCAKGNQPISVITREEGSGTRDAFVELTGVLTKDEDGNKTDGTTKEAITLSSTQGVMSNVAGDPMAIGYISLGSLNDTVKAVKVDGVEATSENVKNGSYTLSRPFNIATKETLSEAAQDFVNYIMSYEGQALITSKGYIAVQEGEAFVSSLVSGKVVIKGSSSVSPVMEKLIESYADYNPNVTIELQTSDSSSGVNDAKEGVCDIGMASRVLKDSEKEVLVETTIAMDGIAVIVNIENPVDALSMDEIRQIFIGEMTEFPTNE